MDKALNALVMLKISAQIPEDIIEDILTALNEKAYYNSRDENWL